MEEQQSTLKMKEDYMDLRRRGFSPKEIAKMYSLNPATVYRALKFIANKHGVSRDSLLVRPRTKETAPYVRRLKHVAPLDLKGLREEDEARRKMMDEELNLVRSLIDISLKEENKND